MGNSSWRIRMLIQPVDYFLLVFSLCGTGVCCNMRSAHLMLA
jgi:hypothetical protein